MILLINIVLFVIVNFANAQYSSSGYIATNPISYSFPLVKDFTGVLSPNNLLAQATRVFENQIRGPTSLAIHKDFIYAGTSGGGVWRGNLRTGNASKIVEIPNELCQTKPWDFSLCGRALGVRTDSKGTLFFVDAYLGLHKVEFNGDEPKVTRLLTVEEVGGKYMGHLVIDEGAGHNGGHVLYITIASTTKDLNYWVTMVMEPDRTGIVVKYDVNLNKAEVIQKDMWYPTSVEITDDKQAILVAEFSSRKVIKIYIKGPKAGTSETWAENLPGEADHLIRSEDKTRETYWMPIVNARNVSNPSLLDWMSDKPQVRKEILDHYQYIGNSVEQIGQKWKNERLERLGFTMKTGLQFYQQNVGNNYGMILEMDKDGRILGSIHSVDGTNSFISEAIEGPSDSPYERVLYIGSFGYPYILKLVLRNHRFNLAPVFLNDDNPEYPVPVSGYRSYPQPLGFEQFRRLQNREPQASNPNDLNPKMLRYQ